ncbi:MAG: hypothetical protein H6981_15245 [Gammaproteobacteria bacterium]|nr:hypothetical protein [Gammaproteobacteria bacterium]MCP5138141.1 hypothetical protein [Gammaproteobacteria bacterium]
MKQLMLQEKYPVFTLEIGKHETSLGDVAAMVKYLKARIAAHPVARLIADFDHYAHTAALEGGEIAEGIIAARNLVFCFGTHLPKPEMLAVRPRSIGIAEYSDRFVVSFLEAPMPLANNAMESWAKALADLRAAA